MWMPSPGAGITSPMQAERTMADVRALYQNGQHAEGLALLHALADRGDPAALFSLGDAYWRGVVVEADHVRARELFARAASASHPMALRANTNLLASGIGGARDWPQALQLLREEARIDGRRALMLQLIEAMRLSPEGDPLALPEANLVSESPRVIYYKRLFSPAECDFLRLVAEPSYERQKVYAVAGKEYLDPVRTAEGATMHPLVEDPAIHAINRRLAAASGTQYEQGEPLLILRYAPGQEYRPHLDAVPGEPNRRILTALVYLNEDYEGGETAFVKTGMQVRGFQGDAIVFRNIGEDGRPDTMSEHAGLPVTRGTKYLASRWIRERRLEG